MSIIDQALKANERYAKTYDPKWGGRTPRPKIAVVTCMDPRLSDLPGILGLKHAARRNCARVIMCLAECGDRYAVDALVIDIRLCTISGPGRGA